MNKVEILDCTLRDGSYVIDFQFTARDTALIGAALQGAGVKLIEIGHGIGMGASARGKGKAAASDEEYCQAAASTIKDAQWGMFFIAGLGSHEDLEMAASYGMNFVRIGTNANEVEQGREYIEHAKRLGMLTAANLMKSYVLPPAELAENARLCQEYGADIVALVDSAGCMFPDDIKNYVDAMREVVSVPLGFHSHNNLNLGIANALMAVECGVQYIDSTLQGMGRGGGNSATEVLATVLKRKGIDTGVDVNRLIDIGTRIIQPMLREKGIDPINLVLGYSGFHSSHLKTIYKYAQRYGVDSRDLIVGVAELDKVNAPEELVDSVARRLQEQRRAQGELKPVHLPEFTFGRAGGAQQTLADAARKMAEEVRVTATKRAVKSVINVVAALSPSGTANVSRFLQEHFEHVIGSVEIDAVDQLESIVGAVDGIVDVLFVDADSKSYLDEPLAATAARLAKKSVVLPYSDNDCWARAAQRQLAAILGGVRGQRIAVCGTDVLARKLALGLADAGAEVVLTGAAKENLDELATGIRSLADNARVFSEPGVAEALSNVRAVAAFDRLSGITAEMVSQVPGDAIVADAGIGAVSPEAIEVATKRGLRVVRPDMRAVLASEVSAALGTQVLVESLQGAGEIAGVPVVAGGVVGGYGAVVVDSLSNPSKVVGVADGRGRVIYERPAEFASRVEAVEKELVRRQIETTTRL